jgi:hypothetical protein
MRFQAVAYHSYLFPLSLTPAAVNQGPRCYTEWKDRLDYVSSRLTQAPSQRDFTTRGLVSRHPQLVGTPSMACHDLCKDILRAGQGGLISSMLRQSKYSNMDRPGTATPSSRMLLSTFGQSHPNVYTESVAAGSSPYWVFGSGGIALPDPSPPGKILSPMPTRCVCVCVCVCPPSPVRSLRSPVTGGMGELRGVLPVLRTTCVETMWVGSTI